MKKNIQFQIEGDDWLWTSNTSSITCLYQNKLIFFAKDYADLWQASVEQPTSIKQPLAGTLRLVA